VRWETLHHIAANLFRKSITKFDQNQPSFLGDITKTILVSFFRTQSVCVHMQIIGACDAHFRFPMLRFETRTLQKQLGSKIEVKFSTH